MTACQDPHEAPGTQLGRPRRSRTLRPVPPSVPEEAIGKAAGTNSTMRELGGVLGIAIGAAAFTGAGGLRLPDRLQPRLRRRDHRQRRPLRPAALFGAAPPSCFEPSAPVAGAVAEG
ncbi:MAG: hypothetical protein JSU06_18905 [Actinobacteria bacterium]|nr:hypothetical protein [Actinomycetota bacterium]